MRLILILSALSSVQNQPSPSKQNVSLPGLEMEHKANSESCFQKHLCFGRTKDLHILNVIGFEFFEFWRQENCSSYLQFKSTIEKIIKYRVVGQSRTSINSDYAANIIKLWAGKISISTRDGFMPQKIESIKDLFSYTEITQNPSIVLHPHTEKRLRAFILGMGETLIGSLLYEGIDQNIRQNWWDSRWHDTYRRTS